MTVRVMRVMRAGGAGVLVFSIVVWVASLAFVYRTGAFGRRVCAVNAARSVTTFGATPARRAKSSVRWDPKFGVGMRMPVPRWTAISALPRGPFVPKVARPMFNE